MTQGFPRKFGKYHLLAPLAQGGMGALYLAVAGERGLEKLCVIKTVLPHLADAEYVSRFRDEAKVVVKLSHGNLVPVFDAGQVGGEIYLAMDFVEGKDLRAVWNRCARKAVAFPVDVAVFITKELCRGLAYAHGFRDLELVHRDVSPPNVLLSFHGEVKLTDFGLASSTLKMEKTAPGVIYGKVSYMSPEQARGEPLDGRSDLYAAGIILWELLTGRQLFPPGKQQPQDLLDRAKNPAVEPPSKRAPRVPPELDAIVLRALEADRDKRYQTGEEMRAALAGWIAKSAPECDAARVEKFVTGLFAEDLPEERQKREALLQKVRDQLTTVPEKSGSARATTQSRVAEESPDQGIHITKKGVAVSVPAPGPGGTTIVADRSGTAPAAVAAAEEEDEDPSQKFLGQLIDGRYSVKSLIGEGGMGRVYEAEHVEIGKRVALKILNPVYSRTPEVVARFRREARAASRIGHPNIVDVTDSGTTSDGSVYFVMEYLEGVELASVIDREGALDVPRSLNIATQICRALAAAHTAGIIHRDLKPENVYLVVREGTADFVKVLDFGIAKSAELEEQRKERLTHPGMAMGTPEYMAPEQAAGQPADARSDVYSVGAILYEMLTGVPPYEGENFMEILTRKATQEPVPARELRPDIPEVVEKLVHRAMARDPKDRPQSMEAFDYELTKCLAGRGAAVAKVLGMAIEPSSSPPASSSSTAEGTLSDDGSGVRPSAEIPDLSNAPSVMVGVEDLSMGTEILPRSVKKRGPGRALFLLVVLAAVAGGAWWYTNQSDEEMARGAPLPPRDTAAATEPAPRDPMEAPAETTEAKDPVERPRPADRKEPPREVPRGEARKEAETHLQRALRSSRPPRNAREAKQILDEAQSALVQMKYAQARTLYERVTKGRHRRDDGYLGLAGVAFQTKNWDDAIEHSRRALKFGGGDKARMSLGNALLRAGRYEEAIEQYEAILKRNPRDAGARRALQEAKKQRGN